MATNKKFLGRGLRFPLRPGPDGGFLKDIESERIINSSIGIILLTRIGERVWNPEFGSVLGSLKHEPNTPKTYRRIERSIFEAIYKWEPRIKNLRVTVYPAQSNQGEKRYELDIDISYRIISTNQAGNLVWPFYLEQ